MESKPSRYAEQIFNTTNKEEFMSQKSIIKNLLLEELKNWDFSPPYFDDPCVKKFNQFIEAENRQKREIEMHLCYLPGQIEKFNASGNPMEKALIFSYFLECPLICRFIFEPSDVEVRSEYQIRTDPPIGGLESRMLTMQSGKLIIMQRMVKQVFGQGIPHLKAGPWIRDEEIPLSEIKKIEKKIYVENYHTLTLHIAG